MCKTWTVRVVETDAWFRHSRTFLNLYNCLQDRSITNNALEGYHRKENSNIPCHPNIYRWIESIADEGVLAHARHQQELIGQQPSKLQHTSSENKAFEMCLNKEAYEPGEINLEEYLISVRAVAYRYIGELST